MRVRQHWRQLLGQGLLAAFLLTGAGCLSCLHPVAQPRLELQEECQVVPKCGRGHVYIFLANGLDPLNCGNLTGLRDYLHELGFTKTYYGQLCHVFWFNSEIRRLHQEDPDARFVLIGYDLGTKIVHSLAQDLQSDGIHIDLLVYLDGKPHSNSLTNQPENVGRVINVLADGLIRYGTQIEGADNCRLHEGGHLGVPSHPVTLDLLAREIVQVAAAVPNPQAPEPDAAPSPSPNMPQISSERDEWDFLKPASRLGNRASGRL